jgi:hypothetical protein
MKKILVPAALYMLLIVGCDKIKDLAAISFDVPLTSQQLVPARGAFTGTFPLTMDFSSSKVATNSAQYLSNNNTSTNLIDSAVMTSLSLIKVNGDSNAHFNFVDTIRIFASATGQSEVLVAYRYGVPANIDSLALTCNDVNLKPYFLADSVMLRVNGHFTALPDSNSALIRVRTSLKVHGNPLN